jgi:hypothetical protein
VTSYAEAEEARRRAFSAFRLVLQSQGYSLERQREAAATYAAALRRFQIAMSVVAWPQPAAAAASQLLEARGRELAVVARLARAENETAILASLEDLAEVGAVPADSDLRQALGLPPQG